MVRSTLKGLAGVAAVALIAGVAAGCGSSDDSGAGGGDTAAATDGGAAGSGERTTGSGATFPAAAYELWGRTSGLASYQSKGSGAGIQDFINGLVQWAGTDAPLNQEELDKLSAGKGGVSPIYFPTLLGAVAVPANVSGVSVPLKLESEAIGEIFAGGITSWNDPAIAATNAGVALPDKPIIVCVRADSSGTSFNFSRYLSRASATFKAKVGENKTPNWTAKVVKQPGNPGVAQCVKANENSIGYVDLGDAQRAGLTDKLVEVGTGSGTFTAPSVETIEEAASTAEANQELIVDPGAVTPKSGYPITITTWIIAYSDYAAAGVSNLAGVKSWLEYVYSPAAQDKLPTLGFAPLPDSVVSPAVERINTLK